MVQSNLGKLFIVYGPSGAGKTTLVDLLMKEIPIKRIVTYTTREPRSREVDGVDYNFITKSEFERMIAGGQFFEFAQYGNYYYGTSKQALCNIQQGMNCIVVVNRQGAQEILTILPDVVTVFVTVENIETLEKRLKKRSSESEESIQKRLEIAQKEIEEEELCPLYQHVVKNANLKDSLGRLIEIFRLYISVEN